MSAQYLVFFDLRPTNSIENIHSALQSWLYEYAVEMVSIYPYFRYNAILIVFFDSYHQHRFGIPLKERHYAR